MKPKTKKNPEEESGWLVFLQNFAENALGQLGNNVLEKINAWTEGLRIKAVSSVLMIIGLVFVLLGLVFFINYLTGEELRWIGFALAGLVAILAGMIINRK